MTFPYECSGEFVSNTISLEQSTKQCELGFDELHNNNHTLLNEII